MIFILGSEGQTCADLQIARLTAANNLTESAIRYGAIRWTEASIVKRIEGLKAQLKAGTLAELLFTVEAHIPVAISRATKVRLIAVPISSCKSCRDCVGRGIEPLIRVLSAAKMWIVEPVSYSSNPWKVCVIRNSNDHRKSRAIRCYSTPLPVTNHM